VIGIDRIASSSIFRRLDLAGLSRSVSPRGRNLAYISIWAFVFAVMSAAGGVGDSHPGQWLPFWRQACQDGRPYACPYLAALQTNFGDGGSAWACNEAGLLHIALSQSGEDLRRTDPAGAARPLRRACSLGLDTACRNLSALTTGEGEFASVPPALDDYPIILR